MIYSSASSKAGCGQLPISQQCKKVIEIFTIFTRDWIV